MKKFKRLKLNSLGFSHVEVVLVVLVLTVVVVVGAYVYKHGKNGELTSHAGSDSSIAYVDPKSNDIIVIDPQDYSQPYGLSSHIDTGVQAYDPTWGENQSVIYFTSFKNNLTSVDSMTPDGKNVKVLRQAPAGQVIASGSIQWSSAANKLAFVQLNPSTKIYTLWTMNPDGTDQKIVASFIKEVDGMQYTWYNNSNSLLAKGNTVTNGHRLGDYNISANGVDTLFSNASNIEMYPGSIAQDNKTFLAITTPDGYANNYIDSNSLPGDKLVKMLYRYTPGAGYYEVSDPIYSPNGQQIAFIRAYGNHPLNSQYSWVGTVYVMNADGTNLHKVGLVGNNDSMLTWSPDSTQLAYAGYYKYGDDIPLYVANANGTKVLEVATNIYPYSAIWSY